MKKIISVMAFLALLFCFAGKPVMADTLGEGIKKISVGDLTVYSIQDQPLEMDIKIFEGPLGDEEKNNLLPTGKISASLNVFIIQTQDGNILMDTGFGTWGPAKSKLFDRLNSLGLGPEKIDMVILTHMHPDHIGGLLEQGRPAFPKAKVMIAGPEYAFWVSDDVEPPTPAVVNAKEPPVTSQLVKRAAQAVLGSPALLGLAEASEVVEELPVADEPKKLSSQQAVAQAYGPWMQTFNFNDEVIPGLIAIEAVGHTPGHTVFMLTSGGQSLLFIGDLVHGADLQFAYPEECATYDMDKKMAVATRLKFFEKAAKEKVTIAGAHLPFPGLGQVELTKPDSFAFKPVMERN